MRGRVCIVTGAARGIGRATAAELAQRGATVVMLCRDAESGRRAVADVQRRAPNGEVALVACDLASGDAIRAAAVEIAGRWPRVHVLINNAGVSIARRQVSADGVEKTFAVNHLAPFLLTHLLLPQLRAAAPSRIVNVTSELERWGRIDFDDLQGERRYNGTRAYLQSKLANVLFTYALAERLDGTGVAVSCVYPGLAATDLLRDRWWWRARWLARLWQRVFLTPEEAGATVAHAAAGSDRAHGSGMCVTRGGACVRTSRRSYDTALGRRLWEVSAALTRAPGA